MGLVHGWVQMQGYSTPEHKDTFALMGFNSSSTPSTATNIDLGSLPVRLLANHIGHEKWQIVCFDSMPTNLVQTSDSLPEIRAAERELAEIYCPDMKVRMQMTNGCPDPVR
jgi:hypothetical protein